MLFYEKLKKDQQNRCKKYEQRQDKDQSFKKGLLRGTGQSAGKHNGLNDRHSDLLSSRKNNNTNIQNCIDEELSRYFELLDGQPPSDLYRMVMSQVEHTLIAYVLEECGNNQSRAAEYLGISRGTLRNKLNEQGLI